MTADRIVSRRRLLAAGLACAGAAATRTALAGSFQPTPWQNEGPFYPVEIPLDSDSDLVTVAGRPEPAAGIVTHLFGRVLNEAGSPVADARVEIWQCDAFGHYHHAGDRGGRADPNFQGYGRMKVDAAGAFRFRTIRPVPYPGRTPHIHFAISGAGIERLTTQMYVAGEPLNERDGLLNRVRDETLRRRLMVALDGAPEIEAGALAGRFDIVLDDKLLRG